MFSKSDESLIQKKAITLDQVLNQIAIFKKGIEPLKLHSPASIGNGILTFSEREIDDLIASYESYQGSIAKFVPASGAASRMFKHLFEFRSLADEQQEEALTNEEGKVWDFFKGLENFAFYSDLKEAFLSSQGYSLEEAHLKRHFNSILDVFLKQDGMNYGSLPKGLLKFHAYETTNRIAAHEQLAEGLGYAEHNGQLFIHFTVSPEHLDLFKKTLSEIKSKVSETEISISYSIQKEYTDTIAVDENNDPFRDENGMLLFRPAGHGALLENLNVLNQELIFIKNIDNVVPDHLKNETIRFKKLIAGVLIKYQQKIFELLADYEKGIDVYEQGKELLEALGTKGPLSKEAIVEKLNRPIRVCGMVKNVGEPGGGPFWIQDGENSILQIVEGAQVNKSDSEQASILAESTHFNPVDLVCGVYDYKGNKFNLLEYRDLNTGFITEKSYDGRKLKALELPGLWNGSMAKWNTLFVEVPIITFNPVKTVNDLLRKEHQ